MPRKENLYAESGMLQAMDSFNKDMAEVAGRVKETNRKFAVTSFLDNLGQMNQPRNYEKMRADLEEATKLAELPQSSDPAVLARAVQESQQKLAAMQQMAALDEMQRQELKDRYVNDNLSLISMMNDDEKASLSYAFPKIAGTLAQFSQGNPFARALGGRGTGPDWEYHEWETGGMSKVVAFDKSTGTHRVLDQQFNPMMGLEATKASAEISRIASDIQMNTIKAQQLMRDGQLPSVLRVGDRETKYVDLPSTWENMPEKDRKAWAAMQAAPHGNDFLEFDPSIPGRLGVVVRMKDPAAAGGGGGGGASSMSGPEVSLLKETNDLSAKYNKGRDMVEEANRLAKVHGWKTPVKLWIDTPNGPRQESMTPQDYLRLGYRQINEVAPILGRPTWGPKKK